MTEFSSKCKELGVSVRMASVLLTATESDPRVVGDGRTMRALYRRGWVAGPRAGLMLTTSQGMKAVRELTEVTK